MSIIQRAFRRIPVPVCMYLYSVPVPEIKSWPWHSRGTASIEYQMRVTWVPCSIGNKLEASDDTIHAIHTRCDLHLFSFPWPILKQIWRYMPFQPALTPVSAFRFRLSTTLLRTQRKVHSTLMRSIQGRAACMKRTCSVAYLMIPWKWHCHVHHARNSTLCNFSTG